MLLAAGVAVGNVDQAALSAAITISHPSQSLPEFGSVSASQLRTIAPTLPAGSIVTFQGTVDVAHFDNGDNLWRGLYLNGLQGTPSQPILIRGLGEAALRYAAPDGSEVRGIELVNSSHVVVEGFEISGYGPGVFVGGSSNITIRDSYIHDIDGIANHNLAAVHIVGSHSVAVEDNLLVDNYDRSSPGNLNNRHVVVFGSPNTTISGNLLINSTPGLGGGISYKHLGELNADNAGSFTVDANVIVNAIGHGISSASPNSRITNNLLVDAGSIFLGNSGGTHQIANQFVAHNTLVHYEDRLGSASLTVFPTSADALPTGRIDFRDNVIVDGRQLDHPDKATLLMNRYGDDQDYRWLVRDRLFAAEGNHYDTASPPRFDLFGDRSGQFGWLGDELDFTLWQARGLDPHGSTGPLALDEAFHPSRQHAAASGWLSGGEPRLQLNVIPSGAPVSTGDISGTATLQVSRAGLAIGGALEVTLASQPAGALSMPSRVTIPAGQRTVSVPVAALASATSGDSGAVQIRASANGLRQGTTWLLRSGDNLADPADADASDSAPVSARDGVFHLAAESDGLAIRATVTQRLAEYDNEFGFAYVDDAWGRVDGIEPGEGEWLSRLLARGRQASEVLVPSGAGVGHRAESPVQPGRYVVFYLVQNATTERWLAENPSNELGRRPLVFTSIADSNPWAFDHVIVRESGNGVELFWEDIEGGGDESFTDLVVKVEHVTQASSATSGSSSDSAVATEGDSGVTEPAASDSSPSDQQLDTPVPGGGNPAVAPVVSEPEQVVYGPVLPVWILPRQNAGTETPWANLVDSMFAAFEQQTMRPLPEIGGMLIVPLFHRVDSATTAAPNAALQENIDLGSRFVCLPFSAISVGLGFGNE